LAIHPDGWKEKQFAGRTGGKDRGFSQVTDGLAVSAIQPGCPPPVLVAGMLPAVNMTVVDAVFWKHVLLLTSSSMTRPSLWSEVDARLQDQRGHCPVPPTRCKIRCSNPPKSLAAGKCNP
jgi:hypothetical protein